ncbi:MAG TPA: nitroreductase family protein [Candidatus Bathyarchaeia archaeon]|nr:nitroreductase family protein [Candidatus Bathyarchaeia archaeon]
MNDFVKIVKSRRSATKFIEGTEIPASDLEEIFSLTKYAPSAFNLQHTHYVVVTDPAKKDEVYEAAYKQYKVKTASAAILVLGDTKAYEHTASIYEGMKDLGILSKQEYDQMVESTVHFYQSRGEEFQKEEAIRNASLSAMQLMLIAKDKGWDTCPMIGYDPEKMAQILDIPERYVPVMLITIGKADLSSERPRGYRKPTSQFVSYNSFS